MITIKLKLKLLFGISLLLVILLSLPAGYAKEKPLAESLAEGKRAEHRGELDEAKKIYLQIYERSEKMDLPDTEREVIVHRLASIYFTKGDLQKALPLYQQGKEIRERCFGSEHLSVAQSLDKIADIYRIQEQYNEAEKQFLRVLEIREKALGSEHMQVASSLNDLADVLCKKNQREKALPYYERALQIRKKLQQDTYIELDGILGDIKLVNPKILSKRGAIMTAVAREYGIAGKVVLSAIFRKDGTITDVMIVRGLGYGLDQSAINAAREVKFEPATRNGEPVNMRAKLEFTFGNP